MPVPDYQSLMLPALEALSGGVEVPLSKVRERVAAAEGLTAEDMRELFSRSHQTIFTNRVSWAVIYMQRAGLVEKVRRGVYRLTAEGERVLAQAHPRIDNEFLGRYPAFVKWRAMSNVRKQNKGIAVPGPLDNIADTPEEALDRVIQQLRDTLIDVCRFDWAAISPAIFFLTSLFYYSSANGADYTISARNPTAASAM